MISRPKVTKHLTNLRKKFCEFRPSFLCVKPSYTIVKKSLCHVPLRRDMKPLGMSKVHQEKDQIYLDN